MLFYESPDESIQKIIKPYLKLNETCRVSKHIKIDNKIYKEVIINKKILNKLSNQASGYLYLTENNEKVDKKDILTKLAYIGYFGETFLDNTNSTSLPNVILSKEDIIKDNKTYEEAIEALDELKKEGAENIDIIKSILEKMLQLRIKNNEKLQEVVDKAGKFIEENRFLDEMICKQLKKIYLDALLINFEKVKLVASGVKYYDDIKKRAEKKRKKLNVRFNTKITTPLFRLDYILSYFKRMLQTYESVLKMSNSEYIKRISHVEKERIHSKISLIRG